MALPVVQGEVEWHRLNLKKETFKVYICQPMPNTSTLSIIEYISHNLCCIL